MKFISELEFPNIVYSTLNLDDLLSRAKEGRALPLGQYAVAFEGERGFYLARDPLGCNKLFFGRDSDGNWVVASRITTAMRHGVHIDELHSCPPGKVLRVEDDGDICLIGGEDFSTYRPTLDWNPIDFQRRVRARLEDAFKYLAREYAGARFVVCLSGGLDSSMIAGFARQYLERVVAATFSYISTEDAKAYYQGHSLLELSSISDDYRHATGVAKALGLPMLPVLRDRSSVATSVEAAVSLCQDWRDFNVHCAVVNLFLAQDIRAAFPGEKVCVITGDLMNELVADYHEEMVEGKVYYPQPKVPLLTRRRFFVRGLDAGDREVGVFNAFGLSLVQPFAAVADLYMDVPEEALSASDAKEALNGPLIHESAYREVGKAKQRAQVGGADMGTLGIFHRLGLDQQALAAIWAAQLPIEKAGTSPHSIIQVGRYRTAMLSN